MAEVSRGEPRPDQATAADAEVIPIGARGRPGRGTGQKPSAAARSLAPVRTGTPASRKAARQTSPETSPETALAPTAQSPTAEQAVPDPVARPAATTADRSLLAGLSPEDWLGGFAEAAGEIFGEAWEPQLARFLAFLRHRLSGDYEVDEYGFDRELTERFFLTALRPVAREWFRLEVRGAEHIPSQGGALIVSNHSGTVPVDAMMTMVSVHDQTGRFLRPLGADLIFRLPLVANLARKGGATLACNEDAERMLRGGELVGVWPEGFKGVGKPYSERYKLQRFGRGGFVAAAMRTRTPIVPLSVVGAEEIYPLIGNVPSLARLLGLPYLPITPFFPVLGPLGLVPLPSKWLMEFGEPIRTDQYEVGAADDPMLVFNVTDQVRETIQQTLHTLLVERGPAFG